MLTMLTQISAKTYGFTTIWCGEGVFKIHRNNRFVVLNYLHRSCEQIETTQSTIFTEKLDFEISADICGCAHRRVT